MNATLDRAAYLSLLHTQISAALASCSRADTLGLPESDLDELQTAGNLLYAALRIVQKLPAGCAR